MKLAKNKVLKIAYVFSSPSFFTSCLYNVLYLEGTAWRWFNSVLLDNSLWKWRFVWFMWWTVLLYGFCFVRIILCSFPLLHALYAHAWAMNQRFLNVLWFVGRKRSWKICTILKIQVIYSLHFWWCYWVQVGSFWRKLSSTCLNMFLFIVQCIRLEFQLRTSHLFRFWVSTFFVNYLFTGWNVFIVLIYWFSIKTMLL